MMKRISILLAACLIVLAADAQLQSPEQFLGYKIGTRYTVHHRLIDYFQYVAKTSPDMVKLVQYGETNEHRPLITAFVSSKKNIANLESIRKNNMALANIESGTSSVEAPVIVWLSYNVHGNETSSSEAALMTLFALTDPANTETKKWLENTIVAIDPCLNPDGRDRYVNWYNTMIGKNWNPTVIAREHREEWPGGRSNHYNYDLNRDWVWQTQVESKQRLALYNQWLPQVHVDFHEQSVNAPYYFAPAAEPYHEVITQWQRDFQKTIGKNNAKYFDQNGWLFFTGERFDLLYPSYGDTYPLYNGSIGMTYEQGGISAGLGIYTNDKDTLSLVDRALHHYTSGMSTIEISSLNASRLIKEFRQYFDDGINGKIGEYKTYVIKNNLGDAQRIQELMKLLDQNGIRYGTASGSTKGFNYNTRKEESFSISANDLVISSAQPKSVMVKALFEPETKLADSVTYDITAWALPYAYGLTAYASKQALKVQNGGEIIKPFSPNKQDDHYAYAIKWQGRQSVKALGDLLQNGIRVRYNELPFVSEGETFDRGTIIINKTGNQKFSNRLWNEVAEICNKHQVKMYPVGSGMVEKGPDFGSSDIHVIKPVKVAILTGEGVSAYSAGQIWDYFDNQISYPVTLVNAKDFNRIRPEEFDVLILPAGRYDFLKDKNSAAVFENWIRSGGRVIAFESAVSQLARQDWSVMKPKEDSASKKDDQKNPYEVLKVYENRERDGISNYIPGAIYKVDVDNTHPLMFGYSNYYYTLKMDNGVYEYIKEGGWNTGYIKKENLMSGFVGNKLLPKVKDGLVFGVQPLSRGSVVYLTDDIIFRNFWETGKLMLANAVFLVGQ